MLSTTLVFAVLGLASATIDNTKAAASLNSRAVAFADGDYILTNVGTNAAITYVSDGQSLFPSPKGNGSPVTFNMNAKDSSIRLAVNQGAGGGAQKCLSAQWGYDEAGDGIGADHAGALYICAVGASADSSSTVEKTKQWWLFVPVSNSSSTSNLSSDKLLADAGDDSDDSNSTSSNSTVCQKSKAWIQRHPLYVNGPRYHHTECASFLRPSQLAALNVTAPALHQHRALARRQSDNGGSVNGGTFYIIAVDHLLDMPTRALTGQAAALPDSGGSKGTNMEIFDEGNPEQQWTITAAN